MSASVAKLQQEDFPVAFADHQVHDINDNTVFYVEWLENDSEFPSLSSGANDDKNFTGGHWELLQRKEFTEDDHILVSVEDDAWSKLSAPVKSELFANIVEKNASELQPKKRTVQPLWSDIGAKCKKVTSNVAENLVDKEDLALELNDIHKSQSRRANRMTKKRQLHDLKNVEFHVEGVFRLANSTHGSAEVTWVPYEKGVTSLEKHSKKNVLNTYELNLSNSRITSRSQALTFTAKFSQNVKRYTYKYGRTIEAKRPIFPDSGEYSVHDTIVKN